ncbi:hypothetical protein [Archangium sp.]|jgi:hypothetical protein|uniref:hypothetical protein n=1 Tax=Archangium sp. TaxID=1872627 RepID=UPI002ED7DF37
MKLVWTLSVLVALVDAPTAYAQDNAAWRGVEPQVQGKSCQELTRDDCDFIDEAIANCPDTCARRSESKQPVQPPSDSRAKMLESFRHDCAKTIGPVGAYFAEPVPPMAYVNRCSALLLKAWDSKTSDLEKRTAKIKEKVKGEYRAACEKKRNAAAANRCRNDQMWNGRQCQNRFRPDQTR